jgi:hypothetical protein
MLKKPFGVFPIPPAAMEVGPPEALARGPFFSDPAFAPSFQAAWAAFLYAFR